MARVLVVEDDPDLLNLLLTRMRRAGHKVVSASNGPDALQVVDERGAPELCVLDVGLPGMDGLALLQHIRSRPGLAALPAVFLSARVLPEDIAKGRALGATYLTKPFVASALLGAVAEALDAVDTPASSDW
jgi:CheY-like chemotaxis protein